MGFYCMDLETDYSEDFSTLHLLNIRFAIVEEDFKFSEGSIVEDLGTDGLGCISTTKVYFLKVAQGKSPAPLDSGFESVYKPNEWAYAIKTSGTTSSRKLVLVSHESIVTNVLDFAKRFQLSGNDVVFGAAPATFDPHVVDVFMAFQCGGTIIYAPKSIKLRPRELTNVFTEHGITVLQCTPSLFYRFEKDEARRLFTNNDQLRIVAFGGEPCPSKEYLRKVIPAKSLENVSIWNLYGTTELSCWAAANPIQLDTPDQIGILQSLLPDTFYRISKNDGQEAEILLGNNMKV